MKHTWTEFEGVFQKFAKREGAWPSVEEFLYANMNFILGEITETDLQQECGSLLLWKLRRFGKDVRNSIHNYEIVSGSIKSKNSKGCNYDNFAVFCKKIVKQIWPFAKRNILHKNLYLQYYNFTKEKLVSEEEKKRWAEGPELNLDSKKLVRQERVFWDIWQLFYQAVESPKIAEKKWKDDLFENVSNSLLRAMPKLKEELYQSILIVLYKIVSTVKESPEKYNISFEQVVCKDEEVRGYNLSVYKFRNYLHSVEGDEPPLIGLSLHDFDV